MKVIFINSHPIQYFAPLYAFLNSRGLETECWYCSDENVKGHLDKQFGVNVAWDIPLLEGYRHRFFKNYSPTPSIYRGFFGLINPGLLTALLRENKSLVVIHGWGYFTNLLAILFARLAGHRVCVRGESPLDQELLKTPRDLAIRKVLLGKLLFSFVHHFLFIGKKNKAFYRYYGVPENKQTFAPYCVDNERFSRAYSELANDKDEVRRELSIPENKTVLLYTAKYISKKRPMDLLTAFHKAADPQLFLAMVGDGELRQQMQAYIDANKLTNVLLAGFVNQSQIVKYYAAADAFVLCSGAGETWGLSVNEAMNFNLPLVVSDLCGCSSDLVQEQENGYVFACGDTDELTSAITKVRQLKPNHAELLGRYSYETIYQSLKTLTLSIG